MRSLCGWVVLVAGAGCTNDYDGLVTDQGTASAASGSASSATSGSVSASGSASTSVSASSASGSGGETPSASGTGGGGGAGPGGGGGAGGDGGPCSGTLGDYRDAFDDPDTEERYVRTGPITHDILGGTLRIQMLLDIKASDQRTGTLLATGPGTKLGLPPGCTISALAAPGQLANAEVYSALSIYSDDRDERWFIVRDENEVGLGNDRDFEAVAAEGVLGLRISHVGADICGRYLDGDMEWKTVVCFAAMGWERDEATLALELAEHDDGVGGEVSFTAVEGKGP